jgi:cell wall-associated NlpC family hydrolase
LFVLILALHLLTIACVPALMASGLAARPSSTQAGNLGLLRVADGSVCAKALVRAYSKLGSRYVLGAKGPDVFDCSGYTRDAYAAANVQLGWTSYEQITQGQRTNCTYADFHGSTTTCWKPGDLLFLQYPAAGDPGGIGQHVAIYDHDGYIVGCENESVGCIRQLPERNHFYRDHFAMGRRIADCPIVSPTSVPAVAAR